MKERKLHLNYLNILKYILLFWWGLWHGNFTSFVIMDSIKYQQSSSCKSCSMFDPLKIWSFHQSCNSLAAISLYGYCSCHVLLLLRTSEEWSIILGSECHHVESLGFIIVKFVTVAGEHITASFKHQRLCFLNICWRRLYSGYIIVFTTTGWRHLFVFASNVSDYSEWLRPRTEAAFENTFRSDHTFEFI